MKALKISILALLTLTACDETKKVIDVAGNVQLAGSYTVDTIGDRTIESDAPTMVFTALDKGIKGNTGCNSYFGNYSIDLYALSFSDIASTEMACGEPIMTNENQFLDALRKTGSYSLEENVLKLYSRNDRSVLITAKRDKEEQ